MDETTAQAPVEVTEEQEHAFQMAVMALMGIGADGVALVAEQLADGTPVVLACAVFETGDDAAPDVRPLFIMVTPEMRHLFPEGTLAPREVDA